MVSIWGCAPLSYSRIGRADLGRIACLDLDSVQLDRFLGSLEEIAAVVRQGPAHSLVAIQAESRMVGFYVVHPDRRDAACWWLGWLAFDRRSQGRGFGRITMTRIMAAFRRLAGCRRIRLLVAPDNAYALRLYARAGFQQAGVHGTGELILEVTLPHPSGCSTRPDVMRRRQATPGHASNEGRLRRVAGPYAAPMIGVQRGPPVLATLAYPGRNIAKPRLCWARRSITAKPYDKYENAGWTQAIPVGRNCVCSDKVRTALVLREIIACADKRRSGTLSASGDIRLVSV